MTRRGTKIVALALSLTAAACGDELAGPRPPAAGSTAPAPASPRAYDGAWDLRSGRGPKGPVTLVRHYGVSLVIQGGRGLSGIAACNHYWGRAAIDGRSFEGSRFAMTQKDCSPGVQRAEDRYLSALVVADHIERHGRTLVLRGPETELVFEAVPPPPVERIVGHTWTLVSLVAPDGERTPARPATLRLLRNGRLTGSTGCRGLTGTWIVDGAQVTITRLTAHGSCVDEPAERREHDDAVLGGLGDGFRVTVDGREMTTTDVSGGAGLVYRR